MTYHDRDRPTPNPRYNRNSSLMWMLGLAAVLIIGGLLFMTMGRDATVADRPAARTTGAATTNDPTAANAPAKSRATDPTGANRASAPAPK
jgi:hypothetical protein